MSENNRRQSGDDYYQHIRSAVRRTEGETGARPETHRTSAGVKRPPAAPAGSRGAAPAPKRSAAPRTQAAPSRSSAPRTGTAASARSSTARTSGQRAASPTARPGASRSAAQRTAPRPQRSVPPRRPAAKAKRKTPAWLHKRVGGFDMETLLALTLIVVVLGALVFVGAMVISSAAEKNTEYVIRDDIADIKSPEQIAAANAAANGTPSGQNTQTGNPSGAGSTPASTDTTPSAGGQQTGNGDGQTGQGGGQSETQPTQTQPAATMMSVGTKSDGLRSCTIRTVGDFVMDKNVIAAGKAYASANGTGLSYDFSGMLSEIGSYMQNADFTVANVDGSMGGESHYKYGYSGYPQFNTPETLIVNLKNVGVDMLTLANNHMLDGWYDGLVDEIKNVENAGLAHVGASRTQEERNTPVIIEINGIKIGFMNYTESLNSMESRGVDKKAVEFGTNWIKNSNCAEDAKKLRQAGAEVIVCYMHWGDEYVTTPNKNQTDMAQKLMKAGVDIIVGGHPHVVQHAEWLTGTNQFGESQRTFCIYSLGNFLSEHTIKNTDGGIIFEFTIQEKGDGTFSIEAPSYITTYVWKTGNDIFGRGFVVVPCAAYINNGTRPSGMSDSEYKAMVASHNNQVAIMSEGVGTQKTR